MSLIDLARLQTSVINSVPLIKYENLLAKYKNVVASDSGIEMTIGEEIASRQNIALSDKLEEKTAEWVAKEKMLKVGGFFFEKIRKLYRKSTKS